MTQRKRTCSTCRYWTKDGVVDVLGTEKQKRVAGICGGIGSTWDWRLEDGWPAGSARALLIDRNAELLTTGDFFCAEWHADPTRAGRLMDVTQSEGSRDATP